MKKLSFIIWLCNVSLSIKAKDNTKTKQHFNEFGIDATGFLKQYLNFGQQNSSYYIPTYYLTYRRYFGCGNLRVQLGGSYTNDQLPNNYSTDTNKYYDRGYSFSGSVGWEFYDNLS